MGGCCFAQPSMPHLHRLSPIFTIYTDKGRKGENKIVPDITQIHILHRAKNFQKFLKQIVEKSKVFTPQKTRLVCNNSCKVG